VNPGIEAAGVFLVGRNNLGCGGFPTFITRLPLAIVNRGGVARPERSDGRGVTVSCHRPRKGVRTLFEKGPDTFSLSYNLEGELVSMTDGDGPTTTYAYDAAGDLTQEVWQNTNHQVTDVLSWTYDEDGRILTAVNYEGAYAFTYNAAGQVATVSEPFGVSLAFSYAKKRYQDPFDKGS
jgi:YD repeat-containing protein